MKGITAVTQRGKKKVGISNLGLFGIRGTDEEKTNEELTKQILVSAEAWMTGVQKLMKFSQNHPIMTKLSFTCDKSSETLLSLCAPELDSSSGSPGETTLSLGRTAMLRQGSGKRSQLLMFILMPVVMAIICTHSQQGESCRWNGSRFRDVFPPVLFNVRFSHFPHLWNKNVKQQSQR